MKLVSILDVTEKVDTWHPAKQTPEGEFSYVDLSSVDQSQKKISGYNRVIGSNAPSRARQLIRAEDILVSTVRPNLNGVAKVPVELHDATASTGFCVLRAKPEMLDADYLFNWVKSGSFVREMIKHSTGANYPAVGDRTVRNSEIPIPFKNGKPDLAEQKRIAAILDKADGIRRKRREALQLADDFLRSCFLDMFGDPVTNPKRWPREPLGVITSIDAPMVDPRLEAYQSLLHYGPDRIEKCTGKLLPAQTALEDGLISGKFLCQPGEVLYSKIRPNLNKVALVKEKCLCSADVYPVKPIDGVLTKEYLWLLLSSDAFLDFVAGFSRRANIPKLNRKQFAAYEAPVPPFKLQQAFSKKVEVLGEIKSKLMEGQEHDLFASLQQRAFKGEL